MFNQARDVAEPEKVAIAEQRPAAIARERRGQKARIGELGRGQRVLVAMIKPACAQLVELDRRDRKRNRSPAPERERRNVVGLRLAPIPPDIDAKRLCHWAQTMTMRQPLLTALPPKRNSGFG